MSRPVLALSAAPPPIRPVCAYLHLHTTPCTCPLRLPIAPPPLRSYLILSSAGLVTQNESTRASPRAQASKLDSGGAARHPLITELN